MKALNVIAFNKHLNSVIVSHFKLKRPINKCGALQCAACHFGKQFNSSLFHFVLCCVLGSFIDVRVMLQCGRTHDKVRRTPRDAGLTWKKGGREISFPSDIMINSKPEGGCQSLRLHGFRDPHPRMRETAHSNVHRNTHPRGEEEKKKNTYSCCCGAQWQSGGHFSHQIWPSSVMAHLFGEFISDTVMRCFLFVCLLGFCFLISYLNTWGTLIFRGRDEVLHVCEVVETAAMNWTHTWKNAAEIRVGLRGRIPDLCRLAPRLGPGLDKYSKTMLGFGSDLASFQWNCSYVLSPVHCLVFVILCDNA